MRKIFNVVQCHIFFLASLDKKKNVTIKCDVSVAAKSTFLYTSTLDLNSIRGLYRGHLVSTVFLNSYSVLKSLAEVTLNTNNDN
jgi:hypothetical protein